MAAIRIVNWSQSSSIQQIQSINQTKKKIGQEGPNYNDLFSKVYGQFIVIFIMKNQTKYRRGRRPEFGLSFGET